MGFLRPLVLFLVVLIVLHLALRVWMRLRERRRLSEDWELGPRAEDREAFLERGMALYDQSFRKRLLWLTIVAPVAALGLLLYLVNET